MSEETVLVEEAALVDDVVALEDAGPVDGPEDDDVLLESLIEEVSIDGMCGVY